MAKVTNPVLSAILEDLKSDRKQSPVQYPRDGDMTVKLVMPEGRTDLKGFYQKFNATFKGDQFVYYLIAGVITAADDPDIADSKRIRFIKVTSVVLQGLVTLMNNKWQLFSDNGPQIVITKGKKNGKAAYSVVAVPDTFDMVEAFGEDKAEWPYPEMSIEEAAKDQEENSATLDKNGGKTSADPGINGERLL